MAAASSSTTHPTPSPRVSPPNPEFIAAMQRNRTRIMFELRVIEHKRLVTMEPNEKKQVLERHIRSKRRRQESSGSVCEGEGDGEGSDGGAAAVPESDTMFTSHSGHEMFHLGQSGMKEATDGLGGASGGVSDEDSSDGEDDGGDMLLVLEGPMHSYMHDGDQHQHQNQDHQPPEHQLHQHHYQQHQQQHQQLLQELESQQLQRQTAARPSPVTAGNLHSQATPTGAAETVISSPSPATPRGGASGANSMYGAASTTTESDVTMDDWDEEEEERVVQEVPPAQQVRSMMQSVLRRHFAFADPDAPKQPRAGSRFDDDITALRSSRAVSNVLSQLHLRRALEHSVRANAGALAAANNHHASNPRAGAGAGASASVTSTSNTATGTATARASTNSVRPPVPPRVVLPRPAADRASHSTGAVNTANIASAASNTSTSETTATTTRTNSMLNVPVPAPRPRRRGARSGVEAEHEEVPQMTTHAALDYMQLVRENVEMDLQQLQQEEHVRRALNGDLRQVLEIHIRSRLRRAGVTATEVILRQAARGGPARHPVGAPPAGAGDGGAGHAPAGEAGIGAGAEGMRRGVGVGARVQFSPEVSVLQAQVRILAEQMAEMSRMLAATYALQLDMQRNMNQQVAAVMARAGPHTFSPRNASPYDDCSSPAPSSMPSSADGAAAAAAAATHGAGTSGGASGHASTAATHHHHHHPHSAHGHTRDPRGAAEGGMDVDDLQVPATPGGSPGDCVICSNKADSVLYRCGHLCVCNVCARHLKNQGQWCPLCRAPIDDIVKVYFS